MLRNPTLTAARSVARRQVIKRNGRLPRVQPRTRIPSPPIQTQVRSFASAAAKATVGSTPTPEAAPVLGDVVSPETPLKLEGNDPTSRYESLVRNGVLRDDEHQRGVVGLLQGLHDQLKGYTPADVPPSHGSTGWVSTIHTFEHPHHNSPLRQLSSFNPFSSRKTPSPPSNIPRGMYLHGSVGTGKTMLMDLFYDTLPAHLHAHRRRVHFHAFMVDVFRRVHAIKHGLPREGKTGHARKVKEWNPMEGKSDERAVGVERLTGGGLFEGFGKWGKGKGMDEEDAIYEAARELAEEGRILCFDEVGSVGVISERVLMGG